MTTTPLTSTGSPTATASATAPTNPNGMLGQNDFLKLMIAQLQAQDPLQPANSNEFIGELTQFTQVEQITNLANSGQLTGGVQLIGHAVSYKDASGLSVAGTVESVQSSAAGVTLTVNGVPGVTETSITEVS